jgi:signal transduction histidine kinase
VEGIESAPFERLEADLEVALYRVAVEALTNCLKHARATHVWVVLQCDEHMIRLRVIDDGQGPNSTINEDDRALHLGILGMCERLRPWGGVVWIEPTPTSGAMVAADVRLRGHDD